MRLFFSFIILLISLTLKAQNNNNGQLWCIGQIQAHLNNEWQVFFQQRYNFDLNSFKREMNYFETGFLYDLSTWFTLGLSFKQLYFNDEDSGYFSESRPQLFGTLRASYSDLYFQLRNRLDYRHFDIKPTYFYYNHKLTLRYTKFPLQPIITEEFFYNIEKPRIEMVRITSGLYYKLNFLKFELYYAYQISGTNNDKKRLHAIGNAIALEF